MSSGRADCPASGSLEYVCGPQDAEDLVRVGSTRWLIASSFSEPGDAGAGSLTLIDAVAKTYRELFTADSMTSDVDGKTYPDCPSIDPDSLQLHGLAIREDGVDHYRLYATSHGGVEAIQAWELDAADGEPVVTWVGCVPLPDDVYANGVVILEDGGFFATKFIDPTAADPYAAIDRGEVNGGVYEWHPGGAVTAVPGTEMSGANGIELSSDGRYLFVAAYGGKEVVRFDLGTDPAPAARLAVEIAPDNLRWTESGTLLTVGVDPVQGTGWSVLEIDPAAMTATVSGSFGGDVALQNASTALQVDDEVWIGTWDGDRIARYPAG